MLTITIGPKKGVVITADNRRVKIFPAFIEQRGKTVRLNDYENIGNIDCVEILVVSQRQASPKKQCLGLEQGLEEGIVHFLNRYQSVREMSFDCYAFANLVQGLPQHAKQFALMHWNLVPARSLPKAGQTIFLMSAFDDENVIFAHAAVYLGSGLFISVYGAGGQLEFATLRDMIRDFRADEVLLATPRT
jgi:hypothetical protein